MLKSSPEPAPARAQSSVTPTMTPATPSESVAQRLSLPNVIQSNGGGTSLEKRLHRRSALSKKLARKLASSSNENSLDDEGQHHQPIAEVNDDNAAARRLPLLSSSSSPSFLLTPAAGAAAASAAKDRAPSSSGDEALFDRRASETKSTFDLTRPGSTFDPPSDGLLSPPATWPEVADDSLTVQSVRTTVMPKISSRSARQQLTGSYLVAKNAPSCLIGLDELERCFPDRKITVFIGTWNTAGQEVPSRVLLDWLLPEDSETTADIYVIGVQEGAFVSNGFKAWESKLQHCLWSCKQVLFHSASLGVQHLAIFVRRELIWFLSRANSCGKNTRIVSNYKTKGAIAIGFQLFGTTMLFISSHLSYGLDPQSRIRDYHNIVQSLSWKSMGWRGSQVIQNADVTFWIGDLNFRLEDKRTVIESLIRTATYPATVDYTILLERDQLRKVIKQGKLFDHFSEAPITFAPTYKYDIGTSNFDTSVKNRVPAYTDRILFRCKHINSDYSLVFPLIYNSVSAIVSSDHKPIYGIFRVELEPGSHQ